MTHVSREDLEASITPLLTTVSDPRAGVFGPDSMMWKTLKEAILMVAGGRAVLLQMAHPFVAYGVDQHSKTRVDPQGRFQRTFEAVHALAFGDLDSAMRHARRVHRIHERVEGDIGEAAGSYDTATRYEANATDALLWVLATLVESVASSYEALIGPLTPPEREQLWSEWRTFGTMFGIPEEQMPSDWSAFQAYFRGMVSSDVLTPTRPAKEIGALVFTGPNLLVNVVFAWYRVMTAGQLPARLREAYGLRFGWAERLVFAASVGTLRFVWSKLPARLRYLPAYVEARRRLKGLSPVDRFGRRLEQLVIGTFAKRTTPKLRS